MSVLTLVVDVLFWTFRILVWPSQDVFAWPWHVFGDVCSPRSGPWRGRCCPSHRPAQSGKPLR